MQRVVIVLGITLALLLAWVVCDGPLPWAVDRGDSVGPSDPALRGLEPDASGATLVGRTKAAGAEAGRGPLGAPPVDLTAAARRGDLHGFVVGLDGVGLAGVSVQVVRYPWQRASVLARALFHEPELGAQTLSARDGSFAVPARPGIRVALRATREGLATVEQGALESGRRLRIVMGPGVALVVTTEDPSGKPLAGVAVRVRIRTTRARGPYRDARTDENGRCRFEDLPPRADVALSARDGVLGGQVWSVHGPTLPDAGEATHTLTLLPGRIVRGVITDAVTGRPVEGARVGMGWTFFKEVHTDAEGRYALGGWAGQGFDEVHALADGYARAEASVGDASTLDIALVRGYHVTGRVVDVRGAPVSGARLSVVGTSLLPHREQRISTAHGRSGRDGTFTLGDLRPGLAHTLIVMKAGFGRHLTEFAPPVAPSRAVDVGDVALPDGLRLDGIVVDADGRPQAQLDARLVGANDDARRLRAPETPVSDDHYGRMEGRRTDDEGRFRFGDLAPGTYRLHAGDDGDSAQAKVVLRAGDNPPMVRLALPPSRRFVVHVVDEARKPVAGQYVGVEPEGAEDVYKATGADGTVSFRVSPHVRFALVEVYYDSDETDTPYLTPAGTRVELSVGEHTIILRAAGVVAGSLLDPQGQPLQKARVLALRGGQSVGSALTDAQGMFRAVLPPGDPVRLLFRGDVYTRRGDSQRMGMILVRRPLEARLARVALDGPAVTLRAAAIPAQGSIRVVVRAPDGAPMPAALVEIKPPPASAKGGRRTDAQGAVEIGGLTRHRVRVVVTPSEAHSRDLAPEEVENVLPEGRLIEVRLARVLKISGVIRRALGRPAAGASVQITGHFDGHSLEVRSSAAGLFEIPLPSDVQGRVTVRAWLHDEQGQLLYAEMSDVDLHGGDIALELKPRSGR